MFGKEAIKLIHELDQCEEIKPFNVSTYLLVIIKVILKCTINIL
jgi:hypothetical protein